MRPAVPLLIAFVIALAAFDAGLGSADRPPAGAVAAQARATSASQSYAAMQKAFGLGGGLFSDSDRRYANAWPVSQALAASIEAGARNDVRRIIAGLQRYRRGTAYQARILPPRGSRSSQFYDDNEWIGLDLVAASQLLGQPALIREAQRIFSFVTTGWDTDRRHACSGGVFWVNSGRIRDRNTVSTANGALLALDLYAVTHQRSYVTWAQRMYNWVNRCLQAPDGLLYDRVDLDGRITADKWTYNQGAMIAVAAGLAQATGDVRYLDRAERLARAALAYYRQRGYSGEPVFFVAIFYRDLRRLEKQRAFALADRERRDYVQRHLRLGADGRFGKSLLDQAGAAQLFAQVV